MSENTGLEVAVIGMAGRFPGAGNIHEFWENLKNGVESISFFTSTELEQAGVEPSEVDDPGYVKAHGILEGIEFFDSHFFGYSPREADLMDPQLRLFHECVWGALEDAGYFPETHGGVIGLYAGATTSFAWEVRGQLSGKAEALGQYAAFQLTNKDFLSVRVSYKLNLKGPAVIVQTACSTSLAAIHTACQAILNGECDMALAGGVSISILKKKGYLYREGMISAPDGHCRTFDQKAKGTIMGNGAGAVLLKRLDEAVKDGDFIYAVVKGSAVNNDGFRKIGFTAPSIEGQAEVILTAQEMAEVEPESITYVETHGTATVLGDPVEISALKLAFKAPGEDTPLKKHYCALGSVKSNMGHLDAAAGVTGFIKTVLSLYHRQIPPSLHFEKPNPQIDFEDSPFYVNTGLIPWDNDTYPLRAGVSSFGMGGTNVHVILEGAPDDPSSGSDGKGRDAERKYQLLLLSAKTASALENMTANLVSYLKGNMGRVSPMGNIAHTLQTGRGAFAHRKMTVCASIDGAIDALTPGPPGGVHTHTLESEEHPPPVIFMFPGQGAQYVDMALGLYNTEPVFREEMDRCFNILAPIMRENLKEILYPSPGGNGGRSEKQTQTEIAQPLLFTIEYALAKLLIKWGIRPYAMIGHSIGEFTAACLSGVLSLEDALEVVVSRGRLMQRMPAGAMLGVPLPENGTTPLLGSRGELSLAAVNSSSLCAVSGPRDAVESFAAGLEATGVKARPLHTSHAFHSPMMDPILGEFESVIGQKRLNPPEKPYISNLTGTWVTTGDAVNPQYWSAHLRKTVLFARGLDELLTIENALFLEVGPGNVLSTFVRKHEKKTTGHLVLNLLRHPGETIADEQFLLTQTGRMWLYGVPIDWRAFHHGRGPRKRVPLPTYPFEKTPYPTDTGAVTGTDFQNFPTGRKPNIADWFYLPQWIRSTPPSRPVTTQGRSPWMILMDDRGLGDRLVKILEKEELELILVEKGDTFEQIDDNRFSLDPGIGEHYDALFKNLQDRGIMPHKIIHLRNITGTPHRPLTEEILDEAQESGYYGLIRLAQAVGKQDIPGTIHIDVVTDFMQEVVSGEGHCPEKAVVLGPVRVIPREYPNIRCRGIDIEFPEPGEAKEQQTLHKLARELIAGPPDPVIALRGNYRWLNTMVPVKLEKPKSTPPALKEKGVYFITGGLGGIGLTLAEHLIKSFRARVVLTGRSDFPPPEGRPRWLETHGKDDPTSRKIQKIRELESAGGEILVFRAGAADKKRMQTVISRVLERFGRIDGVIHSAGIPDGGMIQPRTGDESKPVLAPKINGTLLLDILLKDHPPDFVVYCSSLSSFIGPFGQVAYCSANAFLDAYAHHKNNRTGTFHTSINWGTWQEVGMAVETLKQTPNAHNAHLKDEITPAEGADAFDRIMGGRLPQVAVSVKDLPGLLQLLEDNRAGIPGGAHTGHNPNSPGEERTGPPAPIHKRPELSTKYAGPEEEIEQILSEVFRDFLGIEQVGIDDNFFELGLGSLDLLQISARLKETLGREIPVVTLFNHSTVRTLAQHLEQENTPEPEAFDEAESEPGDFLQNSMDLLNVEGDIDER